MKFELEQELALAKHTILNQKATIESLNRRSSNHWVDNSALCSVPRGDLVAVISQLARKPLTLVAALEALKVAFPDRITVLDTAMESAGESSTFQYGEQAFELLLRLATDYWEEVQRDGDAEAHKLFGKGYAAREKSALSKVGRERRTFIVNGSPVLMEKHLKIGTADNPSDTLRVHFEWIADEKRIVIGHCGKHLTF